MRRDAAQAQAAEGGEEAALERASQEHGRAAESEEAEAEVTARQADRRSES